MSERSFRVSFLCGRRSTHYIGHPQSPSGCLLLKFAPPKSIRRRSVAWSATLLSRPAHYTSLRRTASCISKQLSGQFPPLVLPIIQKISGGKTIKPIVTAKSLCRVLMGSPGNGDLAGNSTRGSFSGSLLAESLRSSIPFRAAADIFFRYHTATVYPIAPAVHGSLETYKRRRLPIFKVLDLSVLSRRVGNTRQAGATAHGWASALRRQ